MKSRVENCSLKTIDRGEKISECCLTLPLLTPPQNSSLGKSITLQTDASYTTIAETAEWQALKEHVAEIDKT